MGTEDAPGGVQGAVEEHQLYPDVIVEPLQVPHVRRRHSSVHVQVRRAVPGDLQVIRRRNGSDPQPVRRQPEQPGLEATSTARRLRNPPPRGVPRCAPL